ncbi:MAG: type I restriction enzyme HsdR N-terminal domain-containing protein [Defluviitaleaceae bacterium]|nr:type I restriction enzyme HsdR N-terminal domain-containing protein [Defluviitaleaceae bacterium]
MANILDESNNSILQQIASFKNMTLASETEVRTKIANPILESLGHPRVNRSEEFPVHMNLGGEKKTKYADIVLFSSMYYKNNKTDTLESRNWVANHSLLVVELKRPSENIEGSLGQAISYVMWTKALYYLVTNGAKIAVFKVIDGGADKPILSCDVADLLTHWTELESHISFDVLNQKKSHLVDDNQIQNRVFDDYCLSMLSMNIPEHEWRAEQSFVCASSNSISLYNVINASKSVITAQSGYGKTYCLYNIAKILSMRYLDGKSDVVPIVLRCSLWSRSFDTLEGGIFAELRHYIPSLTLAGVKSGLMSNNFFLLFDGLDECRNNLDVLLKEIDDISTSSDLGMIVTTKRDSSIKMLPHLFKQFELKGLSEEQINDIAHKVLGYRIWLTHGVSQNLKDFLCAPLFLSMYLSFIEKEQAHGIKPKNLAAVYNHYIINLLDKRIPKYSLDTSLRQILATVAFEMTMNPKDDIKLSEKILSILPNSDVSVVFKELTDSKLIYQYDGVTNFQFDAVKEYFCSIYLAESSEDQIYDYIGIASEKDEYINALILMFGSIRNSGFQNKLLDYLEGNNLALYVKCLYARYSFSNEYADNLTEAACKNLFQQLIISYENIVRTHFSSMIQSFHPWRELRDSADLENAVAVVDGSINLNDYYIYICIDGAESDINIADRVIVDFTNIRPTITKVDDQDCVITPTLSFTDGQRNFSYDLRHYFNGIDCAREIAVKIVYKVLKRTLEGDSLLFSEHPFAQCEYLEQCLKLLPKEVVAEAFKTERASLSLRNVSLAELKELFHPVINLEYLKRNGFGENNISFVILYALITSVIESGIDPLFSLTPKRNFPPRSEGEGIQTSSIYGGYTIDQIKERVATYYDAYQISYRHFVDNLFPTLKNDLTFYACGPIQFQVIIFANTDDRQRNLPKDCTVTVTWEAKHKLSECDTLVEIMDTSERSNWNTRDNLGKAVKTLKFLSRKGYGVGVSNMALSLHFSDFGDRYSLRGKVRNTILNELSKIFNER